MDNLWIALCEVRARPNVEVLGPGRTRAFAHFLGNAADVETFRERIAGVTDAMGLVLVSFEDAQLYEDYASQRATDARLCQLAESANAGGFVKWGTFHTFPADDA